MESGTFYPSANGETYRWIVGSLFQENTSFGRTAGGSPIDAGFIFKDVLIPQGSTITSAYVRWRAKDSRINTCNVKLYLENSVDITFPTTWEQAEGISLTDSITWDNVPEYTQDEWYNTIDISSLVQSLISNPDWVIGKHLHFQVRDNVSATNGSRQVYEYAFSGGSAKPELHIEWEPSIIDLEISSNDISFSSTPLVVDRQVTIYANVHNIGDSTAFNVLVRFYDGDPDSTAYVQINGDQTIPSIFPDSTAITSVNWAPAMDGTRWVCVVVDPAGENEKACKFATVIPIPITSRRSPLNLGCNVGLSFGVYFGKYGKIILGDFE